MENKTAVLVLAGLVLIGTIGALIVINTETTAQISYQVYERPAVLSRPLTKEQCTSPEPDKNIDINQCIANGIWECNYMYPISPGGAQNACQTVCANEITAKCRY